MEPGIARRRIRELEFMVPEFVDRTGGSRWVQAQPANPSQTVKKLGRAREGRSPFELSIVPSGMYGGHGAIFSPENPIFQRKNRFLAGSAPEKSLIFSGDW